MTLDLTLSRTQLIITSTLALVFLLAGLSVIGSRVTPVVAGEPVLLTPARWTAAALARQTRTETDRIYADAEALATLLDAPRTDPVTAMLLAQGIYARQRNGTSATAPARQALIAAAEAAARYAAGTLSERELILIVEEALYRLSRLLAADEPETTGGSLSIQLPDRNGAPRLWTVLLPLVVKRDAHAP